MTALKDKIQRAIESTSNDVQQWHQKPISEIAGAVHDHVVRDLPSDAVNDDLKAQLAEAHERIKTLEGQLEGANNTILDLEDKLGKADPGNDPSGDDEETDDKDPDETEEDDAEEKSIVTKVKEKVTGKKKKKKN